MDTSLYPILKDEFILRSFTINEIDRTAIYNIFNKNCVNLNKDSENLIRFFTGEYSVSEITRQISQNYPRTSLTEINKIVFKSLDQLNDMIYYAETKDNKRIFYQRKKMHGLLDHVYIRLTNRCNLRCIHCSVDAGSKLNHELSFDDWKDVIDQLAEFMVPTITFTGGEPTLLSFLPQIIQYASLKPISVRLMTNGLCLTDELADKLVSSGLRHVNISIDGASPNTHDKIRGVAGAFKKAIEAVEIFMQHNIFVETTSVICHINEMEITKLVELGKGMNIQNMKFVPVIPMKRGKNIDVDQSFRIYKGNIGKLMIYLGGEQIERFNIAERMKNENVLRCNAGEGVLSVGSDGNVYPCNNFETIVLGNICAQSLSEILFQKAGYNEVREHLSIRGSECEFCPDLERCRGGCAMIAYCYSGKYNTCDITRKIFIEALKKEN